MREMLMRGAALPTEGAAGNPPQTRSRRVLRTPDAAQYIGLTASTLEKMRLTGTGPPFIRIGTRAVGYCIDDLDFFIEAGRRASTSDSGPDAHRRSRSRKPESQHADRSP
jgi:predicted DNA-binding transcriptional regulator AlpA